MKRKYSTGGELLKLAASFIPGVGGVVSTGIGLIDQQIEQDKAKQQNTTAPPMKLTINPYGNFAKGGILNDQFIQYNTGSHASGKDLAVDDKGNPNPNANNFVQNNETSVSIDNKQYVMSDTIVNPKTGNTFNIDSMKINKKYPKARFDFDQKNALEHEMKLLSKGNDLQRAVESNVHADGGPIANTALKPFFDAQRSALPLTNSPFPSYTVQPEFDMTPQQVSDQNPSLGLDTTDVVNGAPELTLGKNLAELPQISLSENNNKAPIFDKTSSSPSGLDASTANGIALGAKGLGLVGSIYDATQPALKEPLILPNYTEADNYMKSANIDYTQAKQDAIGVSNIGANMNRGLSSNAAQYQGREQARLAQLQDALSRINMSESNANSQLNLTKGQYETNKAVDTANRKYQREQNQQMNDANKRLFGRQLASDLTQIGSSFNEYAETQKTIENLKEISKFNTTQALAMLQAKYPGWKLDPNMVEQFKAGKIDMDQLIKYSE